MLTGVFFFDFCETLELTFLVKALTCTFSQFTHFIGCTIVVAPET